jgi:uncharacterized protein YecT (DUF1311 family)
MKRVFPALVAILAVVLAPVVVAASPGKPTSAEINKVLDSLYGIRPSFGQCMDNGAGVGIVSIECIDKELAFQDDRLNRAYRSLMAKLAPELKKKLVADEKLWMQYRDTYCAAVVDGLDRPRIDELSCLLNETAKQAGDLETRLFLQG